MGTKYFLFLTAARGARRCRRTGLAAMVCAGLSGPAASASSYIVGNGDDGSDLEGGKIVKSGILIETRAKAIERMKRLGTPSIDHLGTLIPELEKSDIQLVERAVKPKAKIDRGPETSPDGSDVYARTFAEPYAATRFFPAALSLNEEQLIALHVHEALHRALPASVRENESVVTKITLALTANDATIDRARRVVAAELKGDGNGVSAVSGELVTNRAAPTPAPVNERPSSLSYTFQSFSLVKDSSRYPIDSLHDLRTVFYPFGYEGHAVGFGMEFSFLKTPAQAYMMRPLTLIGRVLITRVNDYEVTGLGAVSLNTITSGGTSTETSDTPIGRDFTTVGIEFRRDDPGYYIVDQLSLSMVEEAKRQMGASTETFHAGRVINASIHAGAKYRSFAFGGFAELLLSDSYKTTDGNPDSATAGRFRVLGIGPEASYTHGAMRYSLSGRWVLDSTPGMTVDQIGDLIGYGAGQASVSGSVSFRF